MPSDHPFQQLFETFGKLPAAHSESVNGAAREKMKDWLKVPLEKPGHCILLKAPRAGHGKTHLLTRLQYELGGTHEFVPLHAIGGSRIDAATVLDDTLRRLVRGLPAAGGLTVLDLVARRLFSSALQPLVNSGEVPCQDREGAINALRARPIETFDFHHPGAVTAHWARENFELLGPRLALELSQRNGLSFREVSFWVDAMFRFSATPIDNPARVRTLASTVFEDPSAEIVAHERLIALLGLLTSLMRIILVADEIEGFSSDETAALRFASFLGALRQSADRVDVILSVNQDIWDSAFLPRLSDGLADRLSEVTVELKPLDKAGMIAILDSRSPGEGEKIFSEMDKDSVPSHARGLIKQAAAAMEGGAVAIPKSAPFPAPAETVEAPAFTAAPSEPEPTPEPTPEPVVPEPVVPEPVVPEPVVPEAVVPEASAFSAAPPVPAPTPEPAVTEASAFVAAPPEPEPTPAPDPVSEVPAFSAAPPEPEPLPEEPKEILPEPVSAFAKPAEPVSEEPDAPAPPAFGRPPAFAENPVTPSVSDFSAPAAPPEAPAIAEKKVQGVFSPEAAIAAFTAGSAAGVSPPPPPPRVKESGFLAAESSAQPSSWPSPDVSASKFSMATPKEVVEEAISAFQAAPEPDVVPQPPAFQAAPEPDVVPQPPAFQAAPEPEVVPEPPAFQAAPESSAFQFAPEPEQVSTPPAFQAPPEQPAFQAPPEPPAFQAPPEQPVFPEPALEPAKEVSAFQAAPRSVEDSLSAFRLPPSEEVFSNPDFQPAPESPPVSDFSAAPEPQPISPPDFSPAPEAPPAEQEATASTDRVDDLLRQFRERYGKS